MTVAAENTYETYSGIAAGVALVFSHRVYNASEIVVRYGSGSLAAIGTHYTVDIEADYSGADVTPTAALVALADGGDVVVSRVTPLTQELNLAGVTSLPLAAMEKALDRLTMMAQEVKAAVGTALTTTLGFLTIDLDGKRFTGSGAPVDDADLATKEYVDDVAAGFVLGEIADGTITEAKLASGLTGTKFADDSIPFAKIADDLKTTVRLAAQSAAAGAGTVDAITATVGADLSGGLTRGMMFVIEPAGSNTSTTPTINLTGSESGATAKGAKTIVKGGDTALAASDLLANLPAVLIYDPSLDKFVLVNPANGITPPSASVAVPKRQTVLSGPRTAAGLPDFLPPSSASLAITSQSVTSSAALVATASQGFGSSGQVDRVGRSTSNITWSSLTASSTNYLLLQVNSDGTLTPLSTTTAIVYQRGGAASTTSGQYTFVIDEMTMYLGNGSAANAVYVVPVGEAVTNGTTVTSTRAYAYQGRYQSAESSVQGSSTATSYSHNLGIAGEHLDAKMWLRCKSTYNGYAVGDVVPARTGYSIDGVPINELVLEGSTAARAVTGPAGWRIGITKTAQTNTGQPGGSFFNQFLRVERTF